MKPKLVWNKVARGAQKPVIVFIHHVGGSHRNLLKHIRFVNDLGFDAVSFDLSFHGGNPRVSVHWDFYRQWAKEIEAVCESIPRKKILYAFSRPTTCAVRYTLKTIREKKTDIVALVGDSGPFLVPLNDIKKMIFGIFSNEISLPKKLGFTSMMFLWDGVLQNQVRQDLLELSHLAPELPILSIRGLADELVPPRQIEEIFKETRFKNLNVFEIPGCGHLKGLRDFPDQYKAVVGQFLLEKAPQ